ncbi:J domain-containing protein [Geoalkalibacter halelectricus]|uniref:J domain-containing protein n=1 Tax=Geoalkalibacter halelectricus TaxID=2847045 RepID=UPI003D22D00D
MTKFRTHYDNLKVSRDAPLEVIQAAYKSLSRKYHPDRNPSSPETTRIMAIINASFEVLSDPDKRRQHDAWIATQETITQKGESQLRPGPAPAEPTRQSLSISCVLGHIGRFWLLYGIAALLIWSWVNDEPSSPPPGPKPYQANSPSARQEYVRPAKAPNSTPWPTSAGYVQGYKRLHTDGLSNVTIDNTNNDSDVFAKLVSLDGPKAYPVRQFYIPFNSNFTLNKVTAGNYDIRYRDLNSGHLSRTESFALEEIHTQGGIEYTIINITLYKVQGGNMKTYDLSEEEF